MSSSRPALKVTPFDTRTLSWWRVRSYKAYLIDSILNGFDVPKLYVADFTYSDSALNRLRLPYAIIDGKQRFEAIFDFFEGRITLNSDFRLLDKPQETKKTTLDSFVKVSTQQRDQLELAGRRTQSMLDDLTNIFLPKDRLLSSAGLLPVYYWFIRGIAQAEYPLVRDFLVRFEDTRRSNRQKVDAGSQSTDVDRQLLDYDNFNRSTNDLVSHNGRIAILQERFLSSIRK